MAKLEQFNKDELDLLTTKKIPALQAAASTARAAVEVNRTALEVERVVFGDLAKEVEETMAALGEALSPPDADLLVDELRELIVEQRHSQAKLLDLGETLAAAQFGLEAGLTALDRARANKTKGETALALAKDRQALRDGAKAALAAEPLATLHTKAAAALTEPKHAAAKAAIDALPAELLELAERRRDLRAGRPVVTDPVIDAIEDELGKALQTSAGADGDVMATGLTFRRTEARLLRHVASAQNDFERALAMLQAVVADGDLLTAPEVAAVAATADRQTAQAKALDIIDGQEAVDEAARDYEKAVLLKQLTDPDVDVSADVGVVAKKKALADAITALDLLRTGFAELPDLDAWQVVVPDRAWRRVVDFLEASGILDRLSKTPAAGLSTAIDTAETSHVAALGKAAKLARTRELLDETLTLQRARQKDLRATLSLRLLSAVRGDRD